MTSSRRVRLVAGTVATVALVACLWYAVGRLLADGDAVRVHDLTPTETAVRVESGGSSNRFTVAAWNIAHGRGPVKGDTNWQGRSRRDVLEQLEGFASRIREVDADIVVLNEVDFASAWSRHVNQVQVIARAAGYRYVVEQRNIDVSVPFVSFRFGNAILSRWPIGSAERIDFEPLSRLEDRFVGNHDALFAVVDAPQGELGLVAVHLEHRGEDTRVAAAREIIRRRKAFGGPVVAAGDFNSTPTRMPGAYRSTLGSNAMDVLLGEGGFRSIPLDPPHEPLFTFPAQQPEITIDWILVHGPISIVDAAVSPAVLSDHRMVVATLAR